MEKPFKKKKKILRISSVLPNPWQPNTLLFIGRKVPCRADFGWCRAADFADGCLLVFPWLFFFVRQKIYVLHVKNVENFLLEVIKDRVLEQSKHLFFGFVETRIPFPQIPSGMVLIGIH